ncbi:hypothetical protein OESDEN_15775 [Oesophagostomum dentatum]|uniref:Tudor-knot domain-containing protein n=1 Tax=Oesophagostomum dentatum TaxID=61180 RepID=A0A0B1SHW2_OESDE|nr:hypothetical protein OESDEN_15775 [Oesophagostomum dentatum]
MQFLQKVAQQAGAINGARTHAQARPAPESEKASKRLKKEVGIATVSPVNASRKMEVWTPSCASEILYLRRNPASLTMGPKKDTKKYEVNEKVLCKHGQYYYEAKITEIAEEDGETVYIVHYQGWHKRYDERITASETAEMFLPFTEENVARCKKEIQEASASKSKKRKTKDTNEDETRKSDAGSRASTPTSVARSASVSTPLRAGSKLAAV